LLDKLLADSGSKKFDAIILDDATRWARDNLKSEIGLRTLQRNGIQFYAGTLKYDLNDNHNVAFLQMSAVWAQFQAKEAARKSLQNRYERALKGIPTSGKFPFGRTFNKKTNEWEPDDDKADAIRFAASEIIKGRSVRDTCRILEAEYNLKIHRGTLRHILKNQCGDKWNETFSGYGTVTHTIPDILDEFTIRAVGKQLAENKRRPVRNDIKNYVLNTHIRCAECERALSGVTRKNATGKKYSYYHHPSGYDIDCKAFKYLPLKKAEDAVFDTIFNFTYDQAGFQKAVKERIGDKKDIAKLKRQITSKKKSLTGIKRQLSNLIDMCSEEKIDPDEYDKKRAEYKDEKNRLIETIAKLETKLASWLESEKFIEGALDMRHKFLDNYRSSDRLKKMSYDDKVDLLNYFFNGNDNDGRRYGITIQKNAQGEYELELYGRYLMGPDRYTTIKRRPAICTFTALKTLGKDGFEIDKHRDRISKARYQTISTGCRHQP
jgi:DNA invertase Pin-like site-specific DNA recombinase